MKNIGMKRVFHSTSLILCVKYNSCYDRSQVVVKQYGTECVYILHRFIPIIYTFYSVCRLQLQWKHSSKQDRMRMLHESHSQLSSAQTPIEEARCKRDEIERKRREEEDEMLRPYLERYQLLEALQKQYDENDC